MFKNRLRSARMPGVAVIDHAADLSRKMVARESRGPGDTENAMRRLEAKYGLPFSVLWSLRYRKPKDPAQSRTCGGVALTRPLRVQR